MIKKSLLIASLFLASSNVMAENNGFEISILTGKVSTKQTISANTFSISDNDSNTITTIAIGNYITDSDVISFSKSFVDTEDNVDIDTMALSYKHLFGIEPKNNIKLFVGGTYTIFDTTISGLQALDSNYRSNSISWTTDIISLDLGIKFTEIAKNLSANIGYSIGLYENGTGTVIYDTTALNFDYSNFRQWQIGLNYKF